MNSISCCSCCLYFSIYSFITCCLFDAILMCLNRPCSRTRILYGICILLLLPAARHFSILFIAFLCTLFVMGFGLEILGWGCICLLGSVSYVISMFVLILSNLAIVISLSLFILISISTTTSLFISLLALSFSSLFTPFFFFLSIFLFPIPLQLIFPSKSSSPYPTISPFP